MGGGGGNIHYGIYPADASSTADSLPEHNLGVKEAAENTITFLGDQISWVRKLGPGSVVLDLGSGNGGAAFSNATRFGCKVVGFNLGPQQNQMVEAEARERGIGHLISTVVGNFDEPFPVEFEGTFDAVWSEEAFCHSTDKPGILKKAADALKPGGVLGFTDIMAGELATAEQIKTFTDRNATANMARPVRFYRACPIHTHTHTHTHTPSLTPS
jgi:cyclopropane fatty-acyl-phospholipid synthase-like methyltransferase